MKKIFKQIITNPLFSGSVVMLTGSNLLNFLNYIYHLVMGRLLGPSSYGELVALFSFLGMINMIPSFFGLVVVKYISSAKSKERVSQIIDWFAKKVLIIATVVAILILLTSVSISKFLNITNAYLLIIISISAFFGLISLLYKSVLQGLLKFSQIVFTNFIETSTKLILGTLLVFLGFSVIGASLGFAVASVLGLLLAVYFTKGYHLSKRANFQLEWKPLFYYSIPVLIQSVALTSFYSADLILVKHFFSGHESGIYAALSSLGRIILFGSGPLGAVMFPLVAKRHSEGKDYKRVFFLSLLLTLFLAIAILMLYWIFPVFAINMLYGSLYIEGANILIWFGVNMTLFTLSSLFVSFHLSLGETKVVYFPLIAALLQILGIWFYHHTLQEVVLVSVGVGILLLIGLLLFFSVTKLLVNNDK